MQPWPNAFYVLSFPNFKIETQFISHQVRAIVRPFPKLGKWNRRAREGSGGREGDEMSLVAPIGHPSLDVAGGRENARQSSFHGSFEAHPG